MAYLDGYTATYCGDKGWDSKKATVKIYVNRKLTEEQALDLIDVHYEKYPACWFLIPIILQRKPQLNGTELYETIIQLLDKKIVPYPYGAWK
jgi:hypothetical protein